MASITIFDRFGMATLQVPADVQANRTTFTQALDMTPAQRDERRADIREVLAKLPSQSRWAIMLRGSLDSLKEATEHIPGPAPRRAA